jgi:hypothetical protein
VAGGDTVRFPAPFRHHPARRAAERCGRTIAAVVVVVHATAFERAVAELDGLAEVARLER